MSAENSVYKVISETPDICFGADSYRPIRVGQSISRQKFVAIDASVKERAVCAPRGESSMCPFTDGVICLFERERDIEDNPYQLHLMTGYGLLTLNSLTGEFISPLSREGILPPRQKQLLSLFMRKPGIFISRGEILDEISEGNSEGNNGVDAKVERLYTARLRNSLGQPYTGSKGRYYTELPTINNNMLIQTVSGLGRRLVMPGQLVAA